jgi:hypothetical protein
MFLSYAFNINQILFQNSCDTRKQKAFTELEFLFIFRFGLI